MAEKMSPHRSLRQADEVKTFNNIDMPAPIFKPPTRGDTVGNMSGLVSGGKPPTLGDSRSINDKSKIFTGFTASNLKLDGADEINADTVLDGVSPEKGSAAYKKYSEKDKFAESEKAKGGRDGKNKGGKKTMKTVNISDIADLGDSKPSSPTGATVQMTGLTSFTKNTYNSDRTMDELRNYLVQMDEYSLHNFVVYMGNTLRDTPEFQSFRTAYLHTWGAISFIIDEIEGLLSQFEVKLAVVDGTKVYNLASLGLGSYSRDDLLSCIANEEQVKPYLKAINIMHSTGENKLHRASILIQSIGRRYIAKKRVRALRKMRFCATKLQSIVRLFLFKHLVRHRLFKKDRQKLEKNRVMQMERLKSWWAVADDYASDFSSTNLTLTDSSVVELPNINNGRTLGVGGRVEPQVQTDIPLGDSSFNYTTAQGETKNNRTRLLIYAPSINTPEYLRLEMDNFAAAENAHISMLYQLMDPDVHILYVCPCMLGPVEQSYHEKLLSLLGISTLPKRLHFIVPELLNTLPSHLSLSHVLLCSTAALKRVKMHMKRFSAVFLVPTSVGWAERKLADYLNIPLIASDIAVSISLHSKSYSKRVFMDASMNIPLGAHDVFNVEDLFIAISRLISTNLDVKRWIIKLNYDYNNESVVYLDVDKVKLVLDLRNEQQVLIDMNNGNPSTWFEKAVQLSVRKRLIEFLQKEFVSRLVICRKDIYTSWDYYVKYLTRYGAIVESDPIDSIGYVDGLLFIDPLGNPNFCGAVDLCVDDRYQSMGYLFPQESVPEAAIQGATIAVGRHLYEKFKACGYFSIKFVSFWDSLDESTRLWALGITCGISTAFSCVGTAAVISTPRPTAILSKSLMPSLSSFSSGRFVIYIPITLHSPLKGTRDDIFFKLCKMRGVSFDADRKIGTIFYMIDAIVGGAVSIFCIASSKKKVIEMCVHTLTFISQNFGKPDQDERKCAEQLLNVYLSLRSKYRRENEGRDNIMVGGKKK